VFNRVESVVGEKWLKSFISLSVLYFFHHQSPRFDQNMKESDMIKRPKFEDLI